MNTKDVAASFLWRLTRKVVVVYEDLVVTDIADQELGGLNLLAAFTILDLAGFLCLDAFIYPVSILGDEVGALSDVLSVADVRVAIRGFFVEIDYF